MIVYYTYRTHLCAHDIEPLYQSFVKNNSTDNSVELNRMKRCPAVIDELHNYFLVKNQVDYNLSWSDGMFSSTLYDQDYFNNYILPRDSNMGFVDYSNPSCVFFSEESLEMSLASPWMHDVDISKNATLIPGRYNIGKHIRSIQPSFIFKKPNTTLSFKEGDPQYYVKFHTDKKIKFKKFYYNRELQDIFTVKNKILSFANIKYSRPLSFFYDVFKNSYRKKVIQIIKNNLLD